MRVVECPVCGDALSAADDSELHAHLSEHMTRLHNETADEGYVAANAYDAMDS